MWRDGVNFLLTPFSLFSSHFLLRLSENLGTGRLCVLSVNFAPLTFYKKNL